MIKRTLIIGLCILMVLISGCSTQQTCFALDVPVKVVNPNNCTTEILETGSWIMSCGTFPYKDTTDNVTKE